MFKSIVRNSSQTFSLPLFLFHCPLPLISFLGGSIPWGAPVFLSINLLNRSMHYYLSTTHRDSFVPVLSLSDDLTCSA